MADEKREWLIYNASYGQFWGPDSGGYFGLWGAGLYGEAEARALASNKDRMDRVHHISEYRDQIANMRGAFERLSAALLHGEPPAAAQPAKCLIGEYCQTHRFIHGAEAEELRERIEVLLRTTERESDRDDFEKSSLIAQIWRLLDDVDARDSCAFVEANGEILYPQPILAVAPAVALSPTFPIQLNEKQEAVVKLWALPTTPGMWGSPETVEFNLRTFARKILAEAAALSPSEELTGDEVSSVVAHLGSGPFKNRVLAMLKAEPNIHGRLFTFRDLREHGQDWGGNPWPSEECEVCHGNTQNGVWVCMLCLDELRQKVLSPSEEPKQ